MDSMYREEKKKIIGTIVFSVVFLIIMILSVSYAWYSFNNKNIDVNGVTSNWCTGIKVDVSSGSTISNYLGNAPVSDYSEAGYSSSFTIKNNESNKIKIDISLIDVNIDKELIDSNFMYTIVKGSTKIAEGNFSGINNSGFITMASDIAINSNSSDTYSLILWIKDNNGNQNSMMNKSLTGKIKVTASSSYCSLINSGGGIVSLFNDTVSLEYESDSKIDFSKISSDTNGKGLYVINSTVNDEYPIYYFRGAVTNNNVLFAGFCWKIIRTTDTGGIKMIYNGTPTDNQCTNTTGEATQIGTSAFNNNYSSSPADVGYMYGTRYVSFFKDMSSVTDTYVYGNDVTYSNGTYTLKDTMTSSSWSTDYKTLATKYHYTCLSTSATCSSVYYIHYFGNSSSVSYLTLTGGDNIETAKTKMFTNTTDSKIKTTIDNWYKTNMTSYTDKLEDTIYCNDRTITEGPLLSKDTSGTGYSYFAGYTRIKTHKPSLDCSNSNDAFTVSSSIGNGKLTYPVGLITIDEVMYAGGRDLRQNSTYYLYTNQKWWLGSPDSFYNFQPYAWFVDSSGSLSSIGALYNNYGVRPVVSLAPSIEISSGSGTSTDPYIVK